MTTKKNYLILTGLALTTFSLLSAEVLFTRIFSFIFTHGYVYFIISFAIAGLGIGSFLFYKFKKIINKSIIACIFIPFISVILLFILNFFIPNIYISLILTTILFLDIGIILAYVYKTTNLNKFTIYFIDLLGAALGSISTYFLIQILGVPKTLQITLVLLSIGFWLIYITTKPKKTNKVISMIILIILFFSAFINIDTIIKFPNNADKEISYFISDDNDTIDTSWKAFGRVDLVEINDPNRKVLFIDGGAGSSMIKYIEYENDYEKIIAIGQNTPALALAISSIDLEIDDNVLVMGSGAGIEVTTFLYAGINKITAVEINPDFIALTKKYGEFNGDIYNDHPNVNLVNEEGRKYIRNTDETFKLITFSMPLIKSLRNYQNYAMAENYLFTSNAFTEYRNKLDKDGYLIIIAHDRLEVLRLLMNALTSFKDSGISSSYAMKQIAIIEVGQHRPMLILKNSPFSYSETENLHTAFHTIPNSQEGVNFIPLLQQASHQMVDEYNQVVEHYMFNNMLIKLSKGEINLNDIINSIELNLDPVDDNRPFFYYFEKGIPATIIIILFFAIVFLLSLYYKDNHQRKHSRLFVIIGFGFIMIEIGFIQIFSIFWGQNTLAISLLLTIILLSSGLGSFFVNKVLNKNALLRILILSIPIVLVISILLSSFLLAHFENSNYLIKIIITFLLLFPSFFLMGMVFPMLLSKTDPKIIPKMLALNSLATVAGTTFGLMIAITFGFLQVMIIGVVFYLILILTKSKDFFIFK